jgi:hypothetical protein
MVPALPVPRSRSGLRETAPHLQTPMRKTCTAAQPPPNEKLKNNLQYPLKKPPFSLLVR